MGDLAGTSGKSVCESGIHHAGWQILMLALTDAVGVDHTEIQLPYRCRSPHLCTRVFAPLSSFSWCEYSFGARWFVNQVQQPPLTGCSRPKSGFASIWNVTRPLHGQSPPPRLMKSDTQSGFNASSCWHLCLSGSVSITRRSSGSGPKMGHRPMFNRSPPSATGVIFLSSGPVVRG